MSLQEEFTVRDLARAFDVGENYIFTLCRNGRLNPTETKPIRINRAEVRRFVENKIPSDLFELLDKQSQ